MYVSYSLFTALMPFPNHHMAATIFILGFAFVHISFGYAFFLIYLLLILLEAVRRYKKGDNNAGGEQHSSSGNGSSVVDHQDTPPPSYSSIYTLASTGQTTADGVQDPHLRSYIMQWWRSEGRSERQQRRVTSSKPDPPPYSAVSAPPSYAEAVASHMAEADQAEQQQQERSGTSPRPEADWM